MTLLLCVRLLKISAPQWQRTLSEKCGATLSHVLYAAKRAPLMVESRDGGTIILSVGGRDSNGA